MHHIHSFSQFRPQKTGPMKEKTKTPYTRHSLRSNQWQVDKPWHLLYRRRFPPVGCRPLRPTDPWFAPNRLQQVHQKLWRYVHMWILPSWTKDFCPNDRKRLTGIPEVRSVNRRWQREFSVGWTDGSGYIAFCSWYRKKKKSKFYLQAQQYQGYNLVGATS